MIRPPIGRRGSIVTYTTYEEGVIKGLAEDLPMHRERLLATLDRLVDLYEIIRKHYYHPGFHGSYSLKSVLPAIFPEMGYGDLAVQEGQQAGLEYLRMIDPSTPPEKKEKIRKDLLAYCERDTMKVPFLADALDLHDVLGLPPRIVLCGGLVFSEFRFHF